MLTWSPTRHFRVFTILSRITGLWFSLGGGAILAWAAYQIVRPEVTKDVTTLSGSVAVDGLAAGALTLSIGVFLLTRRAYRPDLGDVEFSDRTMRLLWGLPRTWRRPTVPDRRDQNWWTGDAKVPKNN